MLGSGYFEHGSFLGRRICVGCGLTVRNGAVGIERFSFLAGAVWEGMGIRMGTELRMALALASYLWDRDGFTYGKGVRG